MRSQFLKGSNAQAARQEDEPKVDDKAQSSQPNDEALEGIGPGFGKNSVERLGEPISKK